MTDYRIFETDTYQKDLSRISISGLPKIIEKLRQYVYLQLRSEPHFGAHIKKLKNWSPPTWRYRVGSWRFFYEISEAEKTVYMTAAEHRSEAY